MNAVSGIFAKETGYGFAFTIAQDPAAALSATTLQEQDIDAALEKDVQDARDAKDGGKGKPRPSHLQIIK
jgi:stringent starvation protein B